MLANKLSKLLCAAAVVSASGMLGSCTCADSESSTAAGGDSSVERDATVAQDATDATREGDAPKPQDSSLGEADTCTPRVCTPCDCGTIDDGCGHKLQCDPCPVLQGCAELYGDVAGFVLCEETGERCSFNANKSGMSCREVCESHGGQCLAAYANGTACDSVYSDVDLGCESSDHVTDVCICSRVTSAYHPLPCADASTPGDAEPPPDAGPPAGKTLLYRVDYEDGTTAANPGTSHQELSAAGQTGGTITVVNNPHKDPRNGSNRVGSHQVPSGYRRAELGSQRFETVGRTYIYKVSYYIPSAFFEKPVSWNLISQWKTWPCGDHDGFATQICGNCGIFDDLSAHAGSFEFKYRAEPDCFNATPPMWTGQWVNFVEEVHWANDSTGHVRLWQNGVLINEQKSMKTLFDGFKPTECDMYWGVGIYASSDAGLTLYTDNIEVWAP